MLPAPASTAVPPTAKSKVCWSPDVPPPPVAGAAVGAVFVVGAACAGLAGGLVVSEPFGLAEPAAAPLGDSDGVGEALSPGENDGDPAEGGVDPPEQAETAAEATMVMVPQPMTVSIALSPVPATVMRTFMEPPHASRQVAVPFPGPSAINRHRQGICVAIRPLPAPAGAGFPKAPRPQR